MATKEELLKKMAKLESLNDQLMSELIYLDQLMRSVGFSNGIETIKATAIELIEMEKEQEQEQDYEFSEDCEFTEDEEQAM